MSFPSPPGKLDLTSPEAKLNPYPLYVAARRMGPIVRTTTGRFATTTHAAAAAVLTDPRLGRRHVDRGSGTGSPEDPWTAFDWIHGESMLDREGAHHTRLRRLVQSAFHVGAINQSRSRVEAQTAMCIADLSERLHEAGEADVVSLLAEPVAVRSLCSILGIPEADWPMVRAWSTGIARMYEVDPSAEDEKVAQHSANAFAEYVDRLAGLRSAFPREDLVTALVQARDGSDRLSAHELIATVITLTNSGHTASINALVNGLNSLLSADGELPHLHRSVSLSRSPHDREQTFALLAEEMLRHDAPLQMFTRTAHEDLVLFGTHIPQGQGIHVLIGAANRDPAVFGEPEHFRVSRSPNPHLSFGAGVHACLGAALARIELQTALRMLCTRVHDLAPVRARRRETFVQRGFSEFVVSGRPVGGR